MIDTDKVFAISRAATDRFGMDSPFQILARLTEELGEVASAVNAREGSISKRAKTAAQQQIGENLSREILDLLRGLAQLVDRYDLVDELNEAIATSHRRWVAGGYIRE